MVRAADGSFKGWRWLGLVVLFGATLLVAAEARAQRVERDCNRLPEVRWQELEARLRVLLGVHGRPELGVELRCDDGSAEVVLADGDARTRLSLAPDAELVEGALAAVEAELTRRRGEPPSTPASPASGENERATEPARARPGRDPNPERPAKAPVERNAPAPSRRERTATLLSGGIGLGLGAETWGSELPAFGPRLHLALGHSDVCVVAVESLGFGRLERHASLTFSTELGVAWGAPYAAGRSLGAQLLVGHEWLSSSENAAAPSQTSGVWSAAFGLRGAVPLAPVSLFLGPDFRVRLGKNELGPPLSVGLPSYSVLVQAGVFWIQDAMPAQR